MAEEAPKQNQDSRLRKPPTAGGPRRINPNGQASSQRREQMTTRARPPKKSRLKKALPYLIPGIATGSGIAAGSKIAFDLSNFFGS